jgi:hypothetical protein
MAYARCLTLATQQMKKNPAELDPFSNGWKRPNRTGLSRGSFWIGSDRTEL